MKTKVLISFAVTAKLICVFVFTYAKSRFSYDAAHLITGMNILAHQILLIGYKMTVVNTYLNTEFLKVPLV